MIRVLQVSHNDAAPFPAVCRAHERALRSLGADVSTVFLSTTRAGASADGAHLAPGAISGLHGGALLATRFEGERFDLCVAHRYKACVSARLARPRLRYDRLIAVAHEFGFFANLRRRWLRRIAGRRVELAAVSPALAAELVRTDPLAAPAHVLGNAVDLDELDAVRLARQGARAELGIAPDETAIGVVGRLTPKKQPEVALDVFAAMGASRRSVLHYVGDGETRAALVARATERALGARVRHHGFVPDAARTMAAFDAMIFTSVRDAFGMVLVEAMAAGVPVLAADSTVARDVMGSLGRYFDPRAPTAAAATLGDLLTTQAPAQRTWATEARERINSRHSVAALADAYAVALGMDDRRRRDAS